MDPRPDPGQVAEPKSEALIEHAQALVWLFAEHIDDVRSDMSVFHRVVDVEAMAAARLVAFAVRLVHYQGAVRNAHLSDQAPVAPRPSQPAAAATRSAPAATDPGRREVTASKAIASIDPVLSQVISWG